MAEGNNEVAFVLTQKKKVVALAVKTGKVKLHKGIEKFSDKYDVSQEYSY